MSQLTNIIYAEDECDIQAIAKIALEDIGGLSVRFCSSGTEVLQVIKEFKPDLLLLDVMMPEMDGPATLRAVRQMSDFASIPAIFMTAKIQSNEMEEYQALGALDVIAKPFDPITLADLIRSIWERYDG